MFPLMSFQWLITACKQEIQYDSPNDSDKIQDTARIKEPFICPRSLHGWTGKSYILMFLD